MKWKSLLCSLLFIVVFALAGCNQKDVQPVAIDEKTDKCAICNMSVMDNQFATEVVLENGKALKFDDIGCMYNWMAENKDEKLLAKFVRDYDTKEWVELEKATFVHDKSIKTPMAYNVVSFSDKKEAEQYISEHQGELLTYDQLQQHKWEMNHDMDMHMEGEHSDTMEHDHE
ncbi:nitrous oxide reductase accessory protein NosL [Bacillus songklensis]|uniref:Nitrous oxide reductase accessory protein NosL n=1 Tax=Bacillus songklensis TaxID=1069116 RepID=A0ABV8BA77_9BACI